MRQVFKWLLSYWSRLIDLLMPDRDRNRQRGEQLGKITRDVDAQPVAKIYYGIPGKTFVGLIDKGRIIKTDNKWPLTRRK